jgi:hypothetical protein
MHKNHLVVRTFTSDRNVCHINIDLSLILFKFRGNCLLGEGIIVTQNFHSLDWLLPPMCVINLDWRYLFTEKAADEISYA